MTGRFLFESLDGKLTAAKIGKLPSSTWKWLTRKFWKIWEGSTPEFREGCLDTGDQEDAFGPLASAIFIAHDLLPQPNPIYIPQSCRGKPHFASAKIIVLIRRLQVRESQILKVPVSFPRRRESIRDVLWQPVPYFGATPLGLGIVLLKAHGRRDQAQNRIKIPVLR